MATAVKKMMTPGQTGTMVNQHKNIAQGMTPDTGAAGLSAILGGRPPRVNPDRKMSHSPLGDGSRCCGPSGNMNHGPFR